MPPRVSIVVIGYNDAEHLPAALQSAQAQTLRDIEIVVVDDASSDASMDVAREFAVGDHRIHVHRLDANSGGCSRPRNTGLDHATGDYVMFLDSDDVLTRRAAAQLYAAATSTDAQVTCGRMVRRHHQPRRHLPSNDDLYRRATVLDGVIARPAQLRDTPACGKLFQREFLDANGLRFPEGLLFEDLLFTTTAYAAAERIAIVPSLCYVWNVRRQQAAPSITNRRELRNWKDRFEIHRRIDLALSRQPQAAALQAAKDHKFLTVDWPIFLRELRAFPADRRDELLALAADYVAGRDFDAQVRTGLRAACFLAGRRDLDATLSAADYVTTGGIGTDLVVERDRVYWTRRHLDEPGARDALDVTASGILGASFATTPFLVVAEKVEAGPGTLTLNGRINDVLERLGDDVTAKLQVAGRFGGRVLECPVISEPAPDGLRFTVAVDLRRLARRLHPGVAHELRFELLLARPDGRGTVFESRAAITARDAHLPQEPLPLPNPWSALVGTTGRVLERNGRLVLDLPEVHPLVDSALDLATRGRILADRRLSRRSG